MNEADAIHDHRRTALAYLQEQSSRGAGYLGDHGEDTACHPNTRVRVLDTITAWMNDGRNHTPILWLSGPSGSGKTAVAQSISEHFGDRVIGSFFFNTEQPRWSRTRYLVSTLALHALSRRPEIKNIVLDAIMADPFIFSRSLEEQIWKLFIEPLHLVDLPATERLLLIIDGLEECEGYLVQKALVLALGNAVSSLKGRLYLLITSPRDEHLLEAFSSLSLQTLVRELVLDDSFEPISDIRLVLRAGFGLIYRRHRRYMAVSGVATPWPNEDIIEGLAAKSSGLFIFAKMVLETVGTIDVSKDPLAELDNLTAFWSDLEARHIATSSPHAYLDILYHWNLLRAEHRSIARMACAALLAISKEWQRSPYLVSRLLMPNLESATEEAVYLSFLQTTPLVSSPRYGFRFVHSVKVPHVSVYNFLADPSRAGQFYVDSATIHQHLLRGCLDIIWKSADDDTTSPQYNILPLDYAQTNWVHHLMLCNPTNQFREVLYQYDLKRRLWELSAHRNHFISARSSLPRSSWPLSQAWHRAGRLCPHGNPLSKTLFTP